MATYRYICTNPVYKINTNLYYQQINIELFSINLKKNHFMELTPEIRERLKSVMDSKNETGYTINQKLGISATTVGNYISPKNKIMKADNIKLKAICDLLEIDMEWLEFGHDMVKDRKGPEIKEGPAEGSNEYMLKQILLKINGKNDQFSNIRKDTSLIRDDMGEIKKEVVHLKKEMTSLKAEIQKLKEK